MARKYLCVYYDIIPSIDILSDAEAGRLLKGALHYSAFGETPSLPGNERFAWPMIMAQIDRSNAKYEEQCATNKRIATERYGNARPVTKRNGSLPRQEEEQEEKQEEEKEKDEERKKTKRVSSAFAPPTLEEIEAYCQERNNKVDPERFFDYYTSNGWKVGKNPMKDWKAAVRTWEKSDNQPAPFKEKRILTFMDL